MTNPITQANPETVAEPLSAGESPSEHASMVSPHGPAGMTGRGDPGNVDEVGAVYGQLAVAAMNDELGLHDVTSRIGLKADGTLAG